MLGLGGWRAVGEARYVKKKKKKKKKGRRTKGWGWEVGGIGRFFKNYSLFYFIVRS